MGKWRDRTSHWTRQADAEEIKKRVVATKIERGTLRGKPRVSFDLDRAITLYQQGLSVHQVAAQMGTNGPLVHRRLKEAAVSLRPPPTTKGATVGQPRPSRRKHPELWDESWLREQYATKSSTEIGQEVGVSGPVVCEALKRLGIETTFSKHQSRVHKTSPRAAAQRREKNGKHFSMLQRMLGMSLYRLGFTDIRAEEPFGPYSADWFSPSLGLIFEADGPHHGLPGHLELDQARDECIGLPVIRLNTTDVRRLARATGVN